MVDRNIMLKNNIPSELHSLRKGYLERLPAKLKGLTDLHRQLTEGKATESGLSDYVFQIHKLAGSAALYGLDNVSNVAKALEILLSSFKGNPEALTD